MKKGLAIRTLLALTLAVGLCVNIAAAYAPAGANEEPAEIVAEAAVEDAVVEETTVEDIAIDDISQLPGFDMMEEVVREDGSVYYRFTEDVEILEALLPEQADMLVSFTDRTGAVWRDIPKGYKTEIVGQFEIRDEHTAIVRLMIVEDPDYDYDAVSWYWEVGEQGHEADIAAYAALLESDAIWAAFWEAEQSGAFNYDMPIGNHTPAWNPIYGIVDVLASSSPECPQCGVTALAPRYSAAYSEPLYTHHEGGQTGVGLETYYWTCYVTRSITPYNVYCIRGHFISGPYYTYSAERHSYNH